MQQYCIKWNNHMRNFQLTIPKYFLNQKFLDCNLLVEGKHLVACHKFVLDACSDYFASFLKNKLLDDKNLVICLPNEIKLWEVQALLQFMYHGEVCISQDGLSSLVKCAELLQVKGLCGNETTSIISKEGSSPKPKTKITEPVEDVPMEGDTSNSDMVELDNNESEACEFSEQMIIKREINISDVDANNSNTTDEHFNTSHDKDNSSAHGMIRVKQNLFGSMDKELQKNLNGEEASNSLVYNKKSMDIYVKPTVNEADNEVSRGSTPLMVENDLECENIVCSPALIQYHYNKNLSSQSEDASANKAESLEEYDDDDDDDLFIEEANVCTSDALYSMITQKFEHCDSYTGHDSELRRNLMISSVGSLSQYQGSDGTNVDQGEGSDMKMAIGGLYLRNPRGNQVRQYDVNALYSALQDVKNGHSIYRAAQTYNIPRKTLRNWMKRLHIKSQFPMPKQLKQAAERKKNSSQVKGERCPKLIVNTIELSGIN